MAKQPPRQAILSDTQTFDEQGDLRVVIETPKGSSNKYKYVPDCDCLELATLLLQGMVLPFDFAFVPSTLDDDGAIEAKQKEKGNGAVWTSHDRLLAASLHAREHNQVKAIGDLLEETKEFFVTYNKLRGRKFTALGACSARKAQALLDAGTAGYKKRHRK